MIEGITVTKLARIPDERGAIFPMMRADESDFDGFGEIYFSQVFPGVVKGWHLHQVMILHYVAIVGRVKLVVYDDRPRSATYGEINEFFLGDVNYIRIRIPAQVWNGFKGVGTTPSIVANCASVPHDPQEIVRRDPFTTDIPYDWGLRHG